MKLNLSKRIALLVSIIVLIVSIGLGLSAWMVSSKVVIRQTEEALLELAAEGVKHIESVINRDLSILQELANRERTQTMDWKIQHESLKPDIVRLGYLDIAIVTPDGKAHYILSGEVADLGDRNYVEKAFQGEANISNVLVSRVTNEVVIMYAVPITVNNKIEGVLVARRDGTALNEITDKMGFGENGYAYIMGIDGTIYAHPDRENVLNQRNVLGDIETNGEFKNWGLALEKLGVGNQGVINYELLNTKRYIGISPMANTGWMVGVGAQESDVLSGLNKLRNIIAIGAIIFLVLGLLAAVILGMSISKPIVDLSNIIEDISNYNLSMTQDSKVLKYLRRKDEIGDISNSLLVMHKNLLSLIQDISNASEQVAASSEELTATSQQSATASDEIAKVIEEIAEGASDQANNTQEGALNIDQLSKLMGKNQQELQDINHAADEIEGLKNEGLKIVGKLVSKTKESNDASNTIYDIITNTNKSAEKIENASEMIKSIAEQTNLLALNAAIEAARAGEAGNGFAVVAEEIRKLAEESNRFTEEIVQIIQDLLQKTSYAVSTMENIKAVIKSQAESVEMTNERFEGIANSIEKMGNLIVLINESGIEMQSKRDEIIGVIQNLSAISEENAAGTQEASASVEEQTASMEEIAAASEVLAQLANQMQESVAKFKF